MPARTDALMPQSETGKINCVHRSPLWPVVTRRMRSITHTPPDGSRQGMNVALPGSYMPA